MLAKKVNEDDDLGDGRGEEKLKSDKKQPSDGGWMEDVTLPAGWKSKGRKPANGKADFEAFLSPSGKVLSGRLALIEQLKKEGAGEEWIDRARSGLNLDEILYW